MSNDGKRLLLQTLDGIPFPSMFSRKCFREALDYEANPGDVFVTTYPKCGTTWMQNIAVYIYRKGRPLDSNEDFERMSPFLDMLGAECIEDMIWPNLIKTHLPFTHVPYSPDAKYIYVARNPKDCCVSLFYHSKRFLGLGYWNGEFDDFFELFMTGQVEYGDYFDHLMSWYPHRNDPNVFYTTYEDTKKDIKSIVVKLANFLGKEYADAVEKDNAVLQNIIHCSSFEFMKQNSRKQDFLSYEEYVKKYPNGKEGRKHMLLFVESLDVPKEKPALEFFRKGVVGDWKNHFTREQSKRLRDRFLEKTSGIEIPQWNLVFEHDE